VQCNDEGRAKQALPAAKALVETLQSDEQNLATADKTEGV